MKKYNLSAEFIKWEGTSETSSEADSFDYVIELESEEEAKVRLEALIIDKMSSKSGWSYKLVNSKVSEFPISEHKDLTLAIDAQPVITDQPYLSNQPEVPNVEPLKDTTTIEETPI